MKKTKAIITVGPSSIDIDVLRELISNGADVIRINLTHADKAYCDEIIKKVRFLEKEFNRAIGIMLDTDGPSVRLDKFKEESVIVEVDKKIKLFHYPVICNNTQFSVSYENMVDELEIGDRILLGDGIVELEVVDLFPDYALLNVINGGEIRSNQTVHVRNKSFKMPFLSDKDRKGILYAIKKNVDFIALSYVRDEQDVLEVADMLIENDNNHMSIIAKIENGSAIDNLDEIVKVSDGVMVARGDLGIELSIEKLPFYQKLILKKAHEYEKTAIVATDFLHSMEENIRPTRSEISDIYNAVMDNCDAIMLSGETTIGKYPVEVVDTLTKVILSAEEDFDYQENLEETFRNTKNDITSNIAFSVVDSSLRLKANAILTNTNSGYTALKISYFRPVCPILALSPSIDTTRLLTINYGIIPVLSTECKSTDTIINMCTKKAISMFKYQGGEIVIITGGFPISNKNTNFMKIEVIDKQ